VFLGHELNIEQRQTLTMTPELIQAIKILQYNIQELNEYVEEQILSNPMLEIDAPKADTADAQGGDDICDGFSDRSNKDESAGKDSSSRSDERRREDFDWKEYLQAQEYDDVSYANMKGFSSEQTDDISFVAQNRSSGITLADHLTSQLGFSGLKGKAYEVGEYIIESLDDNGYLTQTAQEIAAQFGVQTHCVEKVIGIIKTFDPTGVGASDLSECLLMQLDEMGIADDMTKVIVIDHIEDLASNRLAVIAKKYGIMKEEVQRIADAIKQLEPKPGRSFSNGADTNYIIPDVIVEKSEDGYSVTIRNDETPRLIVSPYYRKIMKSEEKNSVAVQFLSQRLNSAMWLIKSIDQRRNTISKVAGAVVKHQTEFFDKGRKYLRPLTLRTIADEIGMHESTVSRTVNGKYMQTPRGVFEIKHFFSSGTKESMNTEGVASGGVKAYIEELVGGEDPASPVSDQAIADKLHMDGIDISRRTIAKYRDEIGILSSSARRRY